MTLSLTPITPDSLSIRPVFTVTDGSTSVVAPGTLEFSGATVTESPTGTALVTISGGGTQVVEELSFSVTAAEIKTLFSSPKVLLASPGAGKVIQPFGGLASYTHGGTPYTISGGNNIMLTTSAAAALNFRSLLELGAADSLLAGSSDEIRAWLPNSKSDIASDFGGVWTEALWVNQPLVLYFGGSSAADPTLGNGTFKMVVKYMVLTLP